MSKLNEFQHKIATTLDGMITVDAGPGTGKTYTVVERYLNILNIPKIDPRDIILMTFTKNAAEEMKERLEERLTDKEDVFIQTSTFDAFCLRVVLESPESVTAFLGMKETLTRGAGLVQNETLNFEYFQRFYTGFMKKNAHKYRNAAALASSSVKELYEQIIKKLMSRGIMPLPDYEWFGAPNNVLEGNRNRLLALLRDKNSDPLFAKKILKKLKDDGIGPDILRDETLTEIPDELLKDAVSDDRKYLIYLIHDIYYEYLRSSISDNRLTFGMVSLFALAALYGDESARKRFSYRYVMIDEFQDTDETQLKISLLILKEPNLCVVGDWKQGIYGFRNASIENMTKFDERVKTISGYLNEDRERIRFAIPKTISLSLELNYRSSQEIIDTAFRTLTIKGAAGEPLDLKGLEKKITKITAARPDIGKNTKVELLVAEGKDKEAAAVLCQIQKYVSNPGYIICEDGKERRPKYSDIAVLCPSNQMCRDIRDKAEAAGIPAYLQGDLEIMSTREGKLALAWLRYVNNENDPMGIVAILAEMGYTMSEMDAMLNGDNKNIPEELPALRKKLRGRRRRLNNLLTTVFSFYGLNNDITQSIISALSSAHRESLLTIPDIIRLIEDDIDNGTPYNVDSLLDREAVTIQTMHKSKGLEYPIVIIAGINQGSFPKAQGGGQKFRYDDRYGVRSLYDYVEKDGYHSLIRSWKWVVIDHAVDIDYDEARRLFFVAVSRAKQYLSMTAYNPSAFMKTFSTNNFVRADTDLRALTKAPERSFSERPHIAGYERRRINMSVHDLMDIRTSSGKGDEVGKGTDHGIKVHEAAELLASGKRPKEHLDEIPEIERILDSLKGADILTETECTLPVGDVMIRGVIDLIAVFPDRAEVHDYKTDADESNIEKYRIQVSIYAAVVSSYLGRRTEGFVDFVSLGTMRKVDLLTMNEIAAIVGDARTIL